MAALPFYLSLLPSHLLLSFFFFDYLPQFVVNFTCSKISHIFYIALLIPDISHSKHILLIMLGYLHCSPPFPSIRLFVRHFVAFLGSNTLFRLWLTLHNSIKLYENSPEQVFFLFPLLVLHFHDSLYKSF